MNDLLQIKGSFESRKNTSIPGAPSLSVKYSTSIKTMKKLYEDLHQIITNYKTNENKIVKNLLISIYYKKVVAKSNRTSAFMREKGKTSNDTIVGAKFSEWGNHIITHYVEIDSILNSLRELAISIEIAQTHFKDPITSKEFNKPSFFHHINFDKYKISKSKFQSIIVDCSYIEGFGVETAIYEGEKDAVITFYRTELSAKQILEKLNINYNFANIIDDTTVVLSKNEVNLLLDSAAHLVSMTVDDLSKYSPYEFNEPYRPSSFRINKPKNEPVIGVIDTLFDTNVYFNEWVEYKQILSPEIATEKDKRHGTRVTSIIVDGPRLNPKLDDGCGNFRVKHFGVATAGKFSSITIMREIKKIVINNPEIRVWNLSLGSNEEIHRNFISIEAAALDELQYEQDVIFVIAGTNDGSHTYRKIGSPADSINAIVVNSISHDRVPAEYSRRGPVLNFFVKPDVSYFGGSKDVPIIAADINGEVAVFGTSFAAPWISRKLSFLIDVLGFEREVAKALIIDSAIGWGNNYDNQIIGHGIVPIHINDIVKSKKDEVRIVLSGISKAYDTYNYRFPIPSYKNEYPFVTRATLCYFPKGSRNQGVDYTNTELDIYFGRLKDGKIQSINRNKQSLDMGGVSEEEGRKEYSKWNNVKHIQDKFTENPLGRKVYPSKLWGMKVVSKSRLTSQQEGKMKFGVVITMREINGMNRLDDFVHLFSLNGWIVNRINVDNKIEIYQKAEEKVSFD